MSKLTLYILLVLMINLSCSEKENNQKLFGVWKYCHGSDDFIDQNRAHGYEFMSTNKVRFLPGVFKFERPEGEERFSYEVIDTTISYELSEGNLIYNSPIKNELISKKIIKITDDSLILMGKKDKLEKFIKIDYHSALDTNFNEISLSTTGCYGNCPIMNIIVKSTGEVYYYGEAYNKIEGFKHGTINKQDILRIFQLFSNADIQNMRNFYGVDHTDDESIIVTFLKNGKIYKTIYDYGNAASYKFYWACTALRFLNKVSSLENLEVEDFMNPKELRYFILRKDTVLIEESESFYLWSELKKGKKKTNGKGLMYKILSENEYFRSFEVQINQNEFVSTDGQMYKFLNSNKKQLTIDLGYNFIERNNLKAFKNRFEWQTNQ